MGRAGTVGILLTGLLVAVGALAGASQAAAAQDAEHLIKVSHPGHGEGIHAPGARVRLKVRSGSTVRVEIAGRDVTRRLDLRKGRRGEGTTALRGRLPRSLVPPKPTSVAFIATRAGRSDADHVLVHGVRERRAFMSLRVRKGRSGAAPLARIQTAAHRIHLRADLNGRRIERIATSNRLGVRKLKLTAAEGLRHGRNVFVVRANDAAGRGVAKRRVIRIGKRRIIPGVSGQTHVRADAIARIDARPSFAKGSRLEHHWELASRPDGSEAELRSADRRIAAFNPDVPGHYTLRLTLARQGERRALARQGGAETSGSHTVGVDVAPSITPYGIGFNADPTKGIAVGETTVPMPTTAGAILGVSIDEQTGVATKAFEIPLVGAENTRDVAALTAAINATSPDDLLAIAGAAGGTPSGQPSDDLAAALAHLGLDAPLDSSTGSPVLRAIVEGKSFALIGSPGDAEGVATAAVDSGVIDGRLRPTGLTNAMTGTLVFEQFNFRRLLLQGAAGPVMVSSVNPEPGPSPAQALDQPLGAGNVMRATIIDSVTLEPTATAVGTDGSQKGALTLVQDLLKHYEDDQSKLVLFKMNAPTAYYETRIEYSEISKSLARLGANRDIFIRSLTFQSGDGHDGSPGGEYLFFGGAGVTSPLEASPHITASSPGDQPPAPTSPPDAAGVMRQDKLSRWVPGETSSADDAVPEELKDLTIREPEAYEYPSWVPGSDEQYRAAEMDMFELMARAGAICDGPNCAAPKGIRVNYGNQALLNNIDKALSALRCEGGPIPPPAGATYTKPQLDALRTTVCVELFRLDNMHTNLFTPLKTVYSELRTDSTLDLLSASDSVLGFLQEERDRELAKENKFLGIGGEAGAILGELVTAATEVAEYLLAPETGGASILAGELAGAALDVGGDSLGIASEAQGVGESADKVAPEEVTVGTLFGYIQRSFGYANSRLLETEAIIASDPTKVAAVVDGIRDGHWMLTQSINEGHQLYDVITYQQRVAALQYMLPRMIGAIAKPCDTGGDENDPTTYEGWTAMWNDGAPPVYPTPHRLRSVHLESANAQRLGPFLFGPPLTGDPDPIAAGPSGAALPRSPFFMTQIAPTSSSSLVSNNDCGEVFEN